MRGALVTSVAVALLFAAEPIAVAQEGRATAGARAPARADRALASAERLLARGRRDRALAAFEALARRAPVDGRAAMRLCALTVPEGDETLAVHGVSREEVEAAARTCLELTSAHRQAAEAARAPIAAEAAEAERWARAIGGDRAPYLEQLRERLDERAVPALRRLAVLALRAGAIAEAESSLELARRVRPGDPQLASDLGAIRLARGDAEGAVAFFRAAVVGRPGDRAALHDLAGACLQAGETATGVRILASLASDAPDAVEPWLELAFARIELGEFARAAEDARHALANAAPDDARPALALADALRLAGETAAARAAYQEALRRDPGSPRARASLAALEP
jgi:Flp pilus assembly protein TadD